nr:hypothetical protein [Burkholderia ubonensis]
MLTAITAGTESNAKSTSDTSATTTHRNNGVATQAPFPASRIPAFSGFACFRFQRGASNEEAVSVQRRPYRKNPVRGAIGDVARVIRFRVVLAIAAKHHDRGPCDDHREYEFNPRPERQQPGTDGDEHETKDDRPCNAPVQHAVAQRVRHLEPREDRHKHEQVVDAEHFLERVAGHEQARGVLAVRDPQIAGKRQRYGNPED